MAAALVVEALNQSDANVLKVVLNGRVLSRITHAEIIAGGKLTFQMTDKPPAK